MPYKAIVFDLFGTLVENFSSQAYDQVQVQMANVLDIPDPNSSNLCWQQFPSAFLQSALAQYIDAPVFSCEERIKKPARRVYEIACERLKVQPQECLYVGDRSGGELIGAAAVGMLPILKRVDLTDVYDSHRPEVESWQGITIDEISELSDIVSELA